VTGSPVGGLLARDAGFQQAPEQRQRDRHLDSPGAGILNSTDQRVVGCVMEQEFYRGLAHRVRDLAEKADPFTRRRLLDLAKRYEAKGGASGSGPVERPLPAPRTTPPASIFSGPGEA
jgi:hypothetical protein